MCYGDFRVRGRLDRGASYTSMGRFLTPFSRCEHSLCDRLANVAQRNVSPTRPGVGLKVRNPLLKDFLDRQTRLIAVRLSNDRVAESGFGNPGESRRKMLFCPQASRAAYVSPFAARAQGPPCWVIGCKAAPRATLRPLTSSQAGARPSHEGPSARERKQTR